MLNKFTKNISSLNVYFSTTMIILNIYIQFPIWLTEIPRKQLKLKRALFQHFYLALFNIMIIPNHHPKPIFDEKEYFQFQKAFMLSRESHKFGELITL